MGPLSGDVGPVWGCLTCLPALASQKILPRIFSDKEEAAAAAAAPTAATVFHGDLHKTLFPIEMSETGRAGPTEKKMEKSKHFTT